MEEGDKFEVSVEALSDHNGNTDLAVGKCYELKADAHTLKLTAGGNNAGLQANAVYFEIVKVKDSHKRPARIGGDTVSGNYKLYTLEVKVKR